MQRRFGSFGLALSFLLSFSVALSAQVRTASLSGQVADQSGAVIPQASIAVRRPSTGFERIVQADGQGAFSLTELVPGDYEVSAISAGFSAAVQRLSLRSGEVA